MTRRPSFPSYRHLVNESCVINKVSNTCIECIKFVTILSLRFGVKKILLAALLHITRLGYTEKLFLVSNISAKSQTQLPPSRLIRGPDITYTTKT